ncbi:hypothetical protein SAMN05216553_101477 [Lentzea fradiae]|uniref:Uncharacterized protein n=1 Tax=Lentzea fradiae TaxID=200378 RepID=A0A1G7KTP4_9PSEU|nr:hypothetical protein SAMN05216553_101477 [Lentzea fradiae]
MQDGSVSRLLPSNRKHPVTLPSANDLFSHPETHTTKATAGAPDQDQPSWTNLFQEPVPAQRPRPER